MLDSMDLSANWGPGERCFLFHCPGCDFAHVVAVKAPGTHVGPTWSWDGNRQRPTFDPSLLVTIPAYPEEKIPAVRCHSFIRAGRVEFLSDCSHALAGQTVDIPIWEED